MTTYKQLKANWKAADNPFWHKVGNWCSIVGGIVGPVVILIIVPAQYQSVLFTAWAALMAAIKAGTKLTTK